MLVVNMSACSKKPENENSEASEETETAAAETYPENNVVAISEDGPMFPSLAIEPTENRREAVNSIALVKV